MVDEKKYESWYEWNLKFRNRNLTQTQAITLEMLNDNKSIEDISRLRRFKKETVEKQIIELITMGKIDVSFVISDEKLEYMKLNILDKYLKLSSMREKLGENYSYFEIKCFIASLD